MDLCSINEIKALLARHGFRFSKSMGQNFLIQSWVPQDIAAASGAEEGTGVLEVGPGIGPLTRELAKRADKVASVELDRSLLPILEETLADCPNAEVCPGDILKTDIPALVGEKFSGLTPLACANLPYNITTPAITALIEAGCFKTITVMIQREVPGGSAPPRGRRTMGRFRCSASTAPGRSSSLTCRRSASCPPPRSLPPCCAWCPARRLRRWMTRPTSSGWSGPPSPSGARHW